MPETLGREFSSRIAGVRSKLEQISDNEALKPVRAGGWTKKEILGHLLDSSANNHIRFVRAALEGSYDGPSYAQKEGVELHGYGQMSWSELMEHWRLRNAMLTRLVGRIPEVAMEYPCRIAGHDPVTLRFLIVDYLDHMEHHVRQIGET